MNKILSFVILSVFLNLYAVNYVTASESCITGFACKINNTVPEKKADSTKQKSNKNNTKNKSIQNINKVKSKQNSKNN